MSVSVLTGDCLAVLATLPAGSARCCVTSPPYFGLRDYCVAGQIGMEESPDAYVARLVAVFREVRRVLADDGTLWLNLGDTYASSPPGNVRGVSEKSGLNGAGSDKYRETLMAGHATKRDTSRLPGYKPKDLLGIPWMVAFALRADGWFLRSNIIWHKPNPMPESVRDRPTSAHEHVFLLSKAGRYYYDAAAIAESAESFGRQATSCVQPPKVRALQESGTHGKGGDLWIKYKRETRNARSVWTIATQPFRGAHFATMPPELAERCIKAGSKSGDMILDPFGGAGTTGLVADRLGRNATLIELNPKYASLASGRITDDAPLLEACA